VSGEQLLNGTAAQIVYTVQYTLNCPTFSETEIY